MGMMLITVSSFWFAALLWYSKTTDVVKNIVLFVSCVEQDFFACVSTPECFSWELWQT